MSEIRKPDNVYKMENKEFSTLTENEKKVFEYAATIINANLEKGNKEGQNLLVSFKIFLLKIWGKDNYNLNLQNVNANDVFVIVATIILHSKLADNKWKSHEKSVAEMLELGKLLNLNSADFEHDSELDKINLLDTLLGLVKSTQKKTF